jgi:hypothetical protein
MIDHISLMINDAVSISVASRDTAQSTFLIDNPRETINRILAEVNLSPVRSQATKALKNQSKSGLRRLVSEFTRGSQAFQGIPRIERELYSNT